MNRAHRQIIDLWDSTEQLAGDTGLKPERVRKWRQRQIPFVHWPLIIKAGAKRGKAITPDMFLGIQPVHQAQRRQSKAAA
jgi:hypothetical protein